MRIVVKPPNDLFPDSHDVWLEQSEEAYGLHLASGPTEEAALRSASEELRKTIRDLDARIRPAIVVNVVETESAEA